MYHILSPLSDASSHRGIQMVCYDETIRKCITKLAACLREHMENVVLQGIHTKGCPMCIAAPDEYGVLPKPPHETRPHPSYAFAYYTSEVRRIESDAVQNINNGLWHISNCLPHELVRPDTPHTLLLGMLVHLMK